MSRPALLGCILVLLLCAYYRFSTTSHHTLHPASTIIEKIPIQESYFHHLSTLSLPPVTTASSTPVLHEAPRPVVQRSVLRKLEALDTTHQAPLNRHARSRPIVDRLPEDIKPKWSDCLSPNQQCRFILPVRIAEQESKARMHFLQILQLAVTLDRVLVLPHVDSSRLGACLKQDFQTYYDVNRLQTLYHEHIITINDFKRWTRKRIAKPVSRLVSLRSIAPITTDNSTSPLDPLHVLLDDHPDYSRLPSCISARFPYLRLESPALSVSPVNNGHEYDPPIGAPLANILMGTQDDFRLFSEADVLVLDWNFRHAIFPPSPDQLPMHLAYSPVLHAEAQNLSPSEPFIAVHWRMETVSPDDLPHCAELLVKTVARVAEDDGSIRSVWFATDFPYSLVGGAAHNKSQTFKEFTFQHDDAIQTFRSAFKVGGRLAELKLTGLAEITDDQHLVRDSGVRGILDKLVAIESTVFVSGGRGCSRQQSSYTKQIVSTREEIGEYTAWEMFGEELSDFTLEA